MKKFLLVLLIVILLGGCGLGGWYFLTNNGNAVDGLKLQRSETIKIDWVDNFTDQEKLTYLDNKTESEYINENKQNWLSKYTWTDKYHFLKNNKVEISRNNSTETENCYYLISPNGNTIRVYYDENFDDSGYNYYGLNHYITINNDGTYWVPIVTVDYDVNPGVGMSLETMAYVMVKLEVIK